MNSYMISQFLFDNEIRTSEVYLQGAPGKVKTIIHVCDYLVLVQVFGTIGTSTCSILLNNKLVPVLWFDATVHVLVQGTVLLVLLLKF